MRDILFTIAYDQRPKVMVTVTTSFVKRKEDCNKKNQLPAINQANKKVDTTALISVIIPAKNVHFL